MFIATLKQNLQQSPLGGLTIVGFSGGADSVALLLGLLEAGQKVEAVHCNFHLRDAESDADEAFVRELCAQLGVALHCVDFDTVGYARRHKVSIEMAARELRYDYFERVRLERGAATIAVAHHRDDNVETVLLNLVRGSGLRGLCGMRPRNGYVVRPMLNIPRMEVERYLAERNQPYRTDSTNVDTRYRRNKVRHELLPLLRQLNPNIEATLEATMQRLTEAESRLSAMRSAAEADELSLATLKTSVSPVTDVYEFLSPYGFTPAQCRAIAQTCSEQVGAVYETADCVCVRDRKALIVGRKPKQISPIVLEELNATYEISDSIRLELKTLDIAQIESMVQADNIALLDADLLQFPLTLRSVRTADRFRPLGMKGTQLVSDFLTNRKRNRLQKLAAMCVCDAEGIVWLAGERPDHRARLTAETQCVLRIELK
ncbi:MAG: tRNA lysidine(34) synthetase TilS [Bacteroidaceae bacterium]|nr:tRNA lysidine(34) synthetase TilS [Bacteroidaceae bacterium]